MSIYIYTHMNMYVHRTHVSMHTHACAHTPTGTQAPENIVNRNTAEKQGAGRECKALSTQSGVDFELLQKEHRLESQEAACREPRVTCSDCLPVILVTFLLLC